MKTLKISIIEHDDDVYKQVDRWISWREIQHRSHATLAEILIHTITELEAELARKKGKKV